MAKGPRAKMMHSKRVKRLERVANAKIKKLERKMDLLRTKIVQTRAQIDKIGDKLYKDTHKGM